ncbi:phosphoadenosine phosphosulfate reductase domain-containing protein [Burkholderia contaminans]|uniref:phosphoadenosine phosphosulfate reductase domain-containing protein n=1 Tax=Burkholderia contaminans TaxID=488447 RepID=UPI0009E652C0|nr:phosphoadenosine phosphosulfate reductase family protein [Burkholderia contaminans]MEB4632206.1 phosphoadenosine phosphosulfate reductase family protein [Burkholderia contaminans]MEB4639645.1 phosphoadenosine phosphosulfate reductase family protein [Burkholderia contaminans]MEB4654301.1 phosphoadenosine phosphosulfate reductase family protein [Burkholderia contaminans]MEB4663410.1 phosphoadenosine phosphosulfate reductase family protein [Burkholderia contaminans]MEB4669543.1 phosphoadenosin
MMERPTLHVVSLSGGKDSTATLLVALELHGRENVRVAMADTGNEHHLTYEYVDYLEDALSIPVARLKRDFTPEWWHRRDYVRDKWPEKGVPENVVLRALRVFERGPTGIPFLDLCIIKGRFPSRMAQFCTHFLKTEPLNEYALNLIDETGVAVWSWQGVRIEESEARRNRLQGTGACVRSFEEVGGGLFIYRPVLRWTADSIFEAHRVAGIRPNPLYLQGRNRVGCLCINARKDEIRQWNLRDRDHIEMIAEWESIVSDASKRGNSTFFPAPGETDTARERGNIWQVVEWSKTSRGGRQYDLLADTEPATACSSAYGLCE